MKDKEIQYIRVVTDPLNLEEANKMAAAVGNFVSGQVKTVTPPSKYVGLKICAGALVGFGAFAYLVDRYARRTKENKEEMQHAIYEVLSHELDKRVGPVR